MNNRPGTLNMLKSLKAPSQPPQPLYNRQTAMPPKDPLKTYNQADQNRAAKIRNRALAIAKTDGVHYSEAWRMASDETPGKLILSAGQISHLQKTSLLQHTL